MDQRRLMIALQNMRMSCDSTYLLDTKSDHGQKVDELMSLLEEMFEDHDTKVVVFSQWLRMHELIGWRLARRKWDHVLFHGGVPGPKRKDLIDRFRQEPRCRLFLSTDAGGVGLNLQHANAVANMDLPWNPAVLEQRIGRVHRLGQRRPVHVMHFIARGTIEEGMLNVLAFKKSVFSGVLDGGTSEVFLGGTRLKQFMASVQNASSNIPAAPPEEASSPAAAPGRAEESHLPGVPRAAAEGAVPVEAARPNSLAAGASTRGGLHVPPKALADLLTAGASLLGQLGQSLRQAEAGGAPSEWIARDEGTGRSYLKLPLPEGQAGQALLGALQVLAGALGGVR
jgi:hypothetical protein